ncbi:DMT family transporter [Pseudorhodoferax sp.]|uniref:DMT family transporter n=1 Tax=Pseudorhodoferax sp. TaxID=1993553 RepID=UPI002DD65542|nr:DMT family transporter [Pseudorhodoferax sp.]
MARSLYFLVAVLGGLLVAVQAVLNNRLRQAVDGDALATAWMSFGIGVLCLSALLVLRGGAAESTRALVSALPLTPWWALLGGVCGAGYVLCLVAGVPRLGVAWALAGVLLGQQIGALGLDHLGAASATAVPIDLSRAAGLACLLVGAYLLRPA